MKSYDDEEDFHKKDQKQHRKERKLAQKTDRSKFKKTDLAKRKRSLESLPDTLCRGRVISITGEGIWIDYEGKKNLCSLRGFLKKERGSLKNLIAVGDWVLFSLEDRLIFRVEERTSCLTRVDISGNKEQLIAVNIDQVIISTSILEPNLKPALIDRYLIAAEKGKMHPILVINKIDLLESAPLSEKALYEEFLRAYEPLGIPILSVSVEKKIGIEALTSLLQNKTSVFSGQSGVGKSSLLNACFGLSLKTGLLATKTQKGSHTTTKAELISLPGGGSVIDTPGFRSFGLWNLHIDEIRAHFREMLPFAKKCKYPDCLHINEPSCFVLKAKEKGKIAPLRYASYQTLVEESKKSERKQTWS